MHLYLKVPFFFFFYFKGFCIANLWGKISIIFSIAIQKAFYLHDTLITEKLRTQKNKYDKSHALLPDI